jgi:hypothetical protein
MILNAEEAAGFFPLPDTYRIVGSLGLFFADAMTGPWIMCSLNDTSQKRRVP